MDGFRRQPADSPCPGAKDVGFAGEFCLVVDGDHADPRRGSHAV